MHISAVVLFACLLPLCLATTFSSPVIVWSGQDIFSESEIPVNRRSEISFGKVPMFAAKFKPDPKNVPSVVVVFVQNAISSYDYARFGGFHSSDSISALRNVVEGSPSYFVLSQVEQTSEAMISSLQPAINGQTVTLTASQLTSHSLPFVPSEDLTDLLVVMIPNNPELSPQENFAATDLLIGSIAKTVSDLTSGKYVAIFTSDKVVSPNFQTSFQSDVVRRDNPDGSWTWFTIPILMGLFVVVILVVILYTAFVSLLFTQTPTRYDDAKTSKGLAIKN